MYLVTISSNNITKHMLCVVVVFNADIVLFLAFALVVIKRKIKLVFKNHITFC